MRSAALALCWLMASTVTAFAASRPLGQAESVYVVRCDGRLDVVDARTGALLRRVDLAARLPIKRSPGVAGATFDNCLLNGALYALQERVFYSLVPDQFSEPQSFGLWRFTVPALAAREVRPPIAMEAGVPTLTFGPDGAVKVEVQPERPSALGLEGFAGAKGLTGNTVLARSGPRVLLRLFGPGDDGMSIAVADKGRRTVTRLRSLPATTGERIHFAPGGEIVLVETATAGDATRRSGVLTLFDARTPLRGAHPGHRADRGRRLRDDHARGPCAVPQGRGVPLDRPRAELRVLPR